MGRHSKQIVSSCGIDRRETGYYSTPKFIAEFLAEKSFELFPAGEKVIDPCVGKEEMLSAFSRAGKTLFGIDIEDYGVHEKATFLQADFIELYKNYFQGDILAREKFNPDDFDYWVANPPYNCHELEYIQRNKKELKKIFHDVGVHNMYSMFISAIIDMATEGSIIALLTFDSFLTSKAHKGLREKILKETSLHYLVLCPTDLFWEQKADVRTCLLILQKGKIYQKSVCISNRPKNKKELKEILSTNSFEKKRLEELVLDSPLDNREFILGVPDEVKGLLLNSKRIGELFDCVTGISTGNDSKYLSMVKNTYHKIPFYKNPGSRKFYTAPDAYLISDFLEEEKKVKNFMVRNKRLLFKKGITCSSMGVEFSACFLPEGSAYGVNANIICDEKDVWWLLAYLNSDLVSYIVRGILIRTNMITSGYVSRIPVPEFDKKSKDKLSALAKAAYNFAKDKKEKPERELIEINKEIYEFLNMGRDTVNKITEFCANILKHT